MLTIMQPVIVNLYDPLLTISIHMYPSLLTTMFNHHYEPLLINQYLPAFLTIANHYKPS